MESYLTGRSYRISGPLDSVGFVVIDVSNWC